MVRSAIVLALVTLGLSQPHAGVVPSSAPAVRLLIAEEPEVPGVDDRGLRIDSASYDEVWRRGSVVVRDFPLTIDYAVDLELESFEVAAANARFISRGLLGELPFGYGSCIETGWPGLSYVDPDLPPVGAGFQYLVRGRDDGCGGGGPLGDDSAGDPRPSPCP